MPSSLILDLISCFNQLILRSLVSRFNQMILTIQLSMSLRMQAAESSPMRGFASLG
jgi:hypothetical protein